MNVFTQKEVAEAYDAYYQTEFGEKVDAIEKQLFSDLLLQVSAKSLLDVGCGTGHWTAFFVDKGFDVIAVDNSKAMLSLAKGKDIKADFIYANSEDLPFEAESQQLITSVTMLEFVDDEDAVAAEIYRLLKPGGWFLLGSLNANSILGRNKANDEVFKHAKMFDAEQIENAFHRLEVISQKRGVYLSPDFEILDGTKPRQEYEPVFLATLFQKK